MYLRHTTVTKNGKSHTYWRLVRSIRTGNRVRQQTVAQLGELDAAGRVRARALAEAIVGVERQPGLFDAPGPSESVTVELRRFRLERGRRFGDVWLGLRLWQALGLDALLESLLPPGREEVPWAKMAAVLVLARFCEPSSELHIAEDWFRRTALGDLLGISDDKVNADRLYRALDQVLPQKVLLEFHLKQRLGDLFDLEYDLLLYDITSTYFEGEAAANTQARRGHSRDHRRDCKQVLIGLVVTRDGYPLGYEVFAGNRHDSTTLQEIVERMEVFYGRKGRIWVLDRGMVSEVNLTWLKERGSRYIVGTPRSRLKQFTRAVRHGDWEALRQGLEVQRCQGDDGSETFILCRSAARAVKEQAMRERFVTPHRHGTAADPYGLPTAALRSRQDRATCGSVARQEYASGRLVPRGRRDRPRRQGADQLVTAWRRAELGAVEPGLLCAAEQRRGLGCGRVVAGLHASHRRGGRIPNPEDRPVRSTGVAPDGQPRSGAPAGLFPGVCPAEDTGRLDGAGRVGEQPDDRLGRVGAYPEHGRGGAHDGRADDASALCGAAGQGPVTVVGSPGSEAAATTAAAGRNGPNVVPTFGVDI